MENIIPFPADKARKPARSKKTPEQVAHEAEEHKTYLAMRKIMMDQLERNNGPKNWLTRVYDWK